MFDICSFLKWDEASSTMKRVPALAIEAILESLTFAPWHFHVHPGCYWSSKSCRNATGSSNGGIVTCVDIITWCSAPNYPKLHTGQMRIFPEMWAASSVGIFPDLEAPPSTLKPSGKWDSGQLWQVGCPRISKLAGSAVAWQSTVLWLDPPCPIPALNKEIQYKHLRTSASAPPVSTKKNKSWCSESSEQMLTMRSLKCLKTNMCINIHAYIYILHMHISNLLQYFKIERIKKKSKLQFQKVSPNFSFLPSFKWLRPVPIKIIGPSGPTARPEATARQTPNHFTRACLEGRCWWGPNLFGWCFFHCLVFRVIDVDVSGMMFIKGSKSTKLQKDLNQLTVG